MNAPCIRLARRLNADCQCVSLDRAHLRAELEQMEPDFYAALTAGRPHLFAEAMFFLGRQHAQRMGELIEAIERVAALPAYAEAVLQWAPPSALARAPQKTRGVFLGYDFHLAAEGPKLIEINTNAGGAQINAVLARAQRACCDAVRPVMAREPWPGIDSQLIAMFRAEWRRARGDAPLKTLAIVDDEPQAQFLYPEFVLFQNLFERHGIRARIAAPAELTVQEGALCCGGRSIDMVYNRLTDFALEDPAHAALRRAYAEDLAVVTPHPRAHALYADKRNLAVLSDAMLLTRLGVDAATRAILAAGIPHTELVSAARADEFWARRRDLFFKPATGYGSKAAYRGEKLTRRVFDEILQGGYVAQARVEPSLRRIEVAGEATDMKVDLRNYVYAGEVQLIAARLWRGQTTNFRTPGGGFASVVVVEGD